MKSILIDYQKSASICDCVIHILVLLAQIGIQSRLSILRSNAFSVTRTRTRMDR